MASKDRKPGHQAIVASKRVTNRLPNRPDRELVEEIDLPADFAMAIQTDRSLFLRHIDRPLTAEETRAVANAMAVLMDTNRKLAEEKAVLKDRMDAIIDEAHDLMNGLTVAMGEVRSIRGWADGSKSD